MKKIDSSVIITSLISGIFGLLSTTLTVILPRILDRQKPVPVVHLTPANPVVPQTDRIVPRNLPLTVEEEIVKHVSLINITDMLFITGATILIVVTSVFIVKKIKENKK